jgi:hypothetical protein
MFQLIEKNSGFLFASLDLRKMLEQRNSALRSEVEQLEPNRLLNTAPADLTKYLVDKYTLEVPQLKKDEWSADEREAQIDVRHDQNRWIRDRSQSSYIPGQRIKIEIPFDGEAELLYARASTFSSSSPRAQVRGQSLFLTFELAHDAQRDIRPEIDRTLGEIDQHLGWVQNDVDGFNRSLEGCAYAAIENRRQRILANQGRVASLGIPLKARDDPIKTYAVPSVRRKVTPTLPSASSVPYEPEPVLDTENYEHILNVLQNMAHVMERSPSAFKSMGEEDLRQHFLVQLNGHFEGNATGETFNVGGKTDILLRANGRNIFIAECKFWKGPKHYQETIDQLLGYTAWRDTKTAILVFNRGTNMTTVLAGVKAESENYLNYKRSLDWKHETGFRYVFHQKGDANRELLLTVLVFDVPSAL